MTKEILHVRDVADVLGCSISTAYNYIKRQHHPLPACHVSPKNLIIRRIDFENWLEEAKNAS